MGDACLGFEHWGLLAVPASCLANGLLRVACSRVRILWRAKEAYHDLGPLLGDP